MLTCLAYRFSNNITCKEFLIVESIFSLNTLAFIMITAPVTSRYKYLVIYIILSNLVVWVVRLLRLHNDKLLFYSFLALVSFPPSTLFWIKVMRMS